MRSNILCLETSAAKCSVALTTALNKTTYKEAKESFSHVSQITLLINECLAEAGISFDELDAVAISGGPGSYTGLRVGTSTAKGICFAQDIPLIALDTLKVLGHTLIQGAPDHLNGLFLGVIDARRDEVYLAGFDKNLNRIMDDQAFILLEDSFREISKSYDKVIIGGDAANKTSDILKTEGFIYEHLVPDAGHMSYLALKAYQDQDYADLGAYTPHYLKPPNITVSKKQFFRKN